MTTHSKFVRRTFSRALALSIFLIFGSAYQISSWFGGAPATPAAQGTVKWF